MHWLTTTLQDHPEIAVFIALAVGYWVGRKSWRGFSLGAVTSTLIAAVILGQLDISISANVKAVFFLIFLFAVGYGVGPQFVRGIAKDGLPQAGFAVVMALLSLAAPYGAARIAGYDAGSAAGLFAGSQTLSASMGLATDAINREGLPPEAAKAMLNAMPIAYAVTYIFGTVGSALILAVLGPRLLGIDLVAECKDYELKMGGKPGLGGEGSAWHDYGLRAFRVQAGERAVALKDGVGEVVPSGRVVQRLGQELFDEQPGLPLLQGWVLGHFGENRLGCEPCAFTTLGGLPGRRRLQAAVDFGAPEAPPQGLRDAPPEPVDPAAPDQVTPHAADPENGLWSRGVEQNAETPGAHSMSLISLGWLGDLDSNQGFPSQSRKFYR